MVRKKRPNDEISLRARGAPQFVQVVRGKRTPNVSDEVGLVLYELKGVLCPALAKCLTLGSVALFRRYLWHYRSVVRVSCSKILRS